MGFSCKSARFVLEARDVPSNATTSQPGLQVSCALNELMSIA